MKETISTYKPEDRFLINLAGAIVLSLILALFIYKGYSQGLQGYLISFAWTLAITVTQWFGNSYIFRKLDKKYSWQDHLVKRAILGSLAIVIYSGLAYLVVHVIMFRLVVGRLPENPVWWALRSSFIAIFLSFAICMVFVTIGFFRSWKSSLLEAERFKAEMLMYKYESLQNQINPHFLFNSFTVLSDLVYEDRKKAVAFIKQLSELFRYVLDSRDKELVPIKEEIEFITSFAFLLQTRFEDKLSIGIDVLAEQDELIVPMSLQLLIENCVKHNEISSSKPLRIKVFRKIDLIVVVNNLQLKQSDKKGSQTGLSNLMQQFSYFTDREVLIGDMGDTYSVELPLIKAEKS